MGTDPIRIRDGTSSEDDLIREIIAKGNDFGPNDGELEKLELRMAPLLGGPPPTSVGPDGSGAGSSAPTASGASVAGGSGVALGAKVLATVAVVAFCGASAWLWLQPRPEPDSQAAAGVIGEGSSAVSQPDHFVEQEPRSARSESDLPVKQAATRNFDEETDDRARNAEPVEEQGAEATDRAALDTVSPAIKRGGPRHGRRPVRPGAPASAPTEEAPVAPDAEEGAPAVPAIEELNETELLWQAQRALRSGNAARALELTSEHRRRGGTRLVQERERLAIESLVGLGRRGEAQARADRFMRRYPESAYTQRILDLIGRPSTQR